MRIGYSYWGFLGDHKLSLLGDELSTPDGNATYSWSIIWEAQGRGHVVYGMQADRDAPGTARHGASNFASFSQRRRISAYAGLLPTHGVGLPELDLLLVEWRWPIPGRNTPDDLGSPNFQPDLLRQRELLEHYSGTKTKVVVWDLDHKVGAEDEESGTFTTVLETSSRPRVGRVPRRRVEPPCVVEDLLQHRTEEVHPLKKLVYVGSRYERDDVITEFVREPSDRWPGQVEFYGNWLSTVDECRALWPNVSFNGRITTSGFRRAYRDAAACPLLAKRSYLQSGFVTPRVWEAILFGTIPVGLAPHSDISEYVRDVAADGRDLADVVEGLSSLTLPERSVRRQEAAHRVRRMDVSNFVDVLESLAP